MNNSKTINLSLLGSILLIECLSSYIDFNGNCIVSSGNNSPANNDYIKSTQDLRDRIMATIPLVLESKESFSITLDDIDIIDDAMSEQVQQTKTGQVLLLNSDTLEDVIDEIVTTHMECFSHFSINKIGNPEILDAFVELLDLVNSFREELLQ